MTTGFTPIFSIYAVWE